MWAPSNFELESRGPRISALEGVADFEGLDAALVEWKNDATQRASKAAMANVLAALELVLPWSRGQLRWSHVVVSGWSVMGHIDHTVPEPWVIALVMCACYARSHFYSGSKAQRSALREVAQ